jgi:hypothetical protein
MGAALANLNSMGILYMKFLGLFFTLTPIGLHPDIQGWSIKKILEDEWDS